MSSEPETPAGPQHAHTSGEPAAHADAAGPRRSFIKRLTASIIGAFVALFPLAAGLAVFCDPLRKRKGRRIAKARGEGTGNFIRVTSLDALPDDGTPQFFQVYSDLIDKWTFIPDVPVGGVYLRKVGKNQVIAYNTTCPHAGCDVTFRSGLGKFHCPCHDSTFSPQGERSEGSPSPRGLDELHVELRDNNEVWVRYQDFHIGTQKKIPVA